MASYGTARTYAQVLGEPLSRAFSNRTSKKKKRRTASSRRSRKAPSTAKPPKNGSHRKARKEVGCCDRRPGWAAPWARPRDSSVKVPGARQHRWESRTIVPHVNEQRRPGAAVVARRARGSSTVSYVARLQHRDRGGRSASAVADTDRPWVMTQSWHDLLFAHWPIGPRIRSKVPPEFDIDLFEGRAWVGIVPFYMTNVAPRGIPSLPWVSEFPELNVRTCVSMANRPGVYFSAWMPAAPSRHAARILLNLPYYPASMTVTRDGDAIHYYSRREEERSAEFSATYEPAGDPFEPSRGSLSTFLTEQYLPLSPRPPECSLPVGDSSPAVDVATGARPANPQRPGRRERARVADRAAAAAFRETSGHGRGHRSRRCRRGVRLMNLRHRFSRRSACHPLPLSPPVARRIHIR